MIHRQGGGIIGNAQIRGGLIGARVGGGIGIAGVTGDDAHQSTDLSARTAICGDGALEEHMVKGELQTIVGVTVALGHTHDATDDTAHTTTSNGNLAGGSTGACRSKGAIGGLHGEDDNSIGVGDMYILDGDRDGTRLNTREITVANQTAHIAISHLGGGDIHGAVDVGDGDTHVFTGRHPRMANGGRNGTHTCPAGLDGALKGQIGNHSCGTFTCQQRDKCCVVTGAGHIQRDNGIGP